MHGLYRTLRGALALAIVAILAAAFAASAGAVIRSTPTLDAATATGNNLVVDDFSATDIAIDAHSGPAGQDPGGTASFVAGGLLPIAGPVSCLDVAGNTAVLTVDGPFPSTTYSAFIVRIVDNGGAGEDVFQYFPDIPEVAGTLDCHEGSDAYFGGSLIGRAIVTDAIPEPPAITALEVSPRSFSASPRPTPLERARGATISIGLTTDSTVAFRVRRARPANSGAPPPRNPRRFKRDLGAGESSVRFSGTLGKFTLPPGRYRLTARARDSLKQPSARVSTRFRIKP